MSQQAKDASRSKEVSPGIGTDRDFDAAGFMGISNYACNASRAGTGIAARSRPGLVIVAASWYSVPVLTAHRTCRLPSSRFSAAKTPIRMLWSWLLYLNA